MDASEIIEAFGGYRNLADDLGLGRTTVFMWRTTGVPKARCLELAALAKERGLKGVTLEVLMQSKPTDPASLPPGSETPRKKHSLAR
jgi:hypothetical protein